MKRRALITIFVCVGALSWASFVEAVTPSLPAGVSPGDLDRFAESADRCPTFSWVAAPGAVSHELVVYELGDEAPFAEDLPPVILRRLPGSAASWTPSLVDCLDPDTDYAWSVRARDEEGPGEWSVALFFRVAGVPSPAEVKAALEVLRRHLDGVLESEVAARGDQALAESSERAAQAAPSPEAKALEAVLSGVIAIRGETPDPSGATYGVAGVSHSPQGAGVGAENAAGGPDLYLAGSPGAAFSEESVDRNSATDTTFDVRNSGAGSMTLLVDGESVVTVSTDRDALGALSCSPGEIAKWMNDAWSCASDADSNTTYAPGNQLTLNGGTFDVVEGSGSDLDADTVDGQDSTAFAEVVHGHDYGDLPATVARTDAANTFTTGVQTIETGQPASRGLVVKGAQAQSASLQEWQDSTGAAVASLSPTGAFVGSAVSGSGAGLTSLDASNLSSGQVSAARGGLGLDTSSTPTGSLLYASATGTWSVLGAGSDDEVLKLVAGIPAWSADSGGTVTAVATGTGLSGGPITSSGTLAIDPAVVPQLGTANTFTNGTQTLQTGDAATTGLIVQGASGQTASLQEWQDFTGAVLASVGAAGVFSGNGDGLTNISASNLASGTVAPARGGLGFDTSSASAGSLLYASSTGSWATLPKGTDGEVLALAAGMPAWSPDTSGTVTSVGSGTGLTGGPITASGTLSIDTSVVPRLGSANTFTNGTQTLQTGDAATSGLIVQGVSGQTASLQEWQNSTGAVLASVGAGGAFAGDGAGLTNLDASNLASGTVAPARGGLGFDTSSASAGSFLYASSTGSWATLPKGTDGEVLTLAAGMPAWSPGTSGTVTSVGSGTGLTGGPITASGTLSIDTSVVPRLGSANTFTTTQTVEAGGATSVGLVAQGASGQTADLQQWRSSSGVVLAAVTATGGFLGDGSGLSGISADTFSGSLNGDVTGTQSATTVARLQGTTVSSTAPSSGQVLRYNGVSTEWEAGSVVLSSSSAVSGVLPVANGGTGSSSGLSLNGDVTGTQSATTVAKIQGTSVSSTAPSGGQVLRYNGVSTEWEGGAVLLSSSSAVSGVLPVANGGTGRATNGTAFVDMANTFTATQTMHPVSGTSVGLVVQGASGQTAALQQWKDQSGVTRAWVTADGVFFGDGSGLTGVSSSSGGMLSARVGGLPAGSVTAYGAVTGISSATTIESNVTTLSMARSCVASDLAVELTLPPGIGSQWVVTLRAGGVATALTCTVADTETSCTSSASEVIPGSSELAFGLASPTAASSGSSALIGWACR